MQTRLHERHSLFSTIILYVAVMATIEDFWKSNSSLIPLFLLHCCKLGHVSQLKPFMLILKRN